VSYSYFTSLHARRVNHHALPFMNAQPRYDSFSFVFTRHVGACQLVSDFFFLIGCFSITQDNVQLTAGGQFWLAFNSYPTLHLTLASVICLIHPVLSKSYDDKFFYYPINSKNQFIQKKKKSWRTAHPAWPPAPKYAMSFGASRPWDASIPATAA
jgi:hypothetical protein